MRELRVAFTDFWNEFDPSDNPFLRAFAQHRDVIAVPPDAADVLVYGNFGRQHERFVGTKVAYSGECVPPNWSAADFAIGFEFSDDPRYLRLPLFAYTAIEDQRSAFPSWSVTPWAERHRFCSFVYSVPGDPIRKMIFESLSEYQRVDSAGSYLKNIDEPSLAARKDREWRASKIEYQQQFRFVVAFENRAHPGYTTEKLYDAIVSGSIPIYWGNPDVDRDFDARSFIWCRGPWDLTRVVDEVMALDADSALAAQRLTFQRTPLIAPEEYMARLQDFLAGVAEFATRGAFWHQRRRAIRRRSRSYAALMLRRARALGDALTRRH